jgi:hypothetical protein
MIWKIASGPVDGSGHSTLDGLTNYIFGTPLFGSVTYDNVTHEFSYPSSIASRLLTPVLNETTQRFIIPAGTYRCISDRPVKPVCASNSSSWYKWTEIPDVDNQWGGWYLYERVFATDTPDIAYFNITEAWSGFAIKLLEEVPFELMPDKRTSNFG